MQKEQSTSYRLQLHRVYDDYFCFNQSQSDSLRARSVRSHRAGYLQKMVGAEDEKLDPILRLDPSTHFLCYRLLRNVISGICAPWFLARDMAKPLCSPEEGPSDILTDSEGLFARNYIMAICVEEEKWSKIHVV